jgi:hypothetical protein
MIAALRGKAPQAAADTAPVATAAVSSAAERRQLTVMFCDLVGSTALSLGRHYQQYPDEYADADDEHGNEIYPTEPHCMSLSGTFNTRHCGPPVLQV